MPSLVTTGYIKIGGEAFGRLELNILETMVRIGTPTKMAHVRHYVLGEIYTRSNESSFNRAFLALRKKGVIKTSEDLVTVDGQQVLTKFTKVLPRGYDVYEALQKENLVLV